VQLHAGIGRELVKRRGAEHRAGDDETRIAILARARERARLHQFQGLVGDEPRLKAQIAMTFQCLHGR
jgi:hypothetical protein